MTDAAQGPVASVKPPYSETHIDPPILPFSSPIVQTLADRQTNYGEFLDNAIVAQRLKDILRAAPMWAMCSFDKREALDVICDKISRIVAGANPDYKDNWHDIQGYAKLAEDRCKGA